MVFVNSVFMGLFQWPLTKSGYVLEDVSGRFYKSLQDLKN